MTDLLLQRSLLSIRIRILVHSLSLNLTSSFFLLIYGVLILRVFVSDIIVKKNKYDGSDYYWIVGILQSGMELIIVDNYYDLREFVGHYVDMLISFMRSPYCELQRGIRNQIFSPEEFYSMELVDELLSKKEVVSTGNGKVVVLTGEYIDSYTIPEKWIPLTQGGAFEVLFKEPSALKTEDGTFLLYPIHSRRAVPIEKVPQEVTTAGSLSLEAWTLDQ